MSTDIEQQIRDAYLAAAAVIDRIEDQRRDQAPLRLPARLDSAVIEKASRSRLVVAVVASAAAVVIVIASVFALKQGRSQPAQPLTSSPRPSVTATPTPSPTPTTTRPSPPPAVNGLHAAACSVTLPDQWSTRLFAGAVLAPIGAYDFPGKPVEDVSAGGDVLIARNMAAPPDLQVARYGGKAQTVYALPSVDSTVGGPAQTVVGQIDDQWILVAIGLGNGQPEIRQLLMISRATGQATTFRSFALSDPVIVSHPALYQGQAYWTEVDNTGHGQVLTYDPTNGVVTTLDRGSQILPVFTVGGGLYWGASGRLIAHQSGVLPAGFTPRVGKTNTLLHDGDTYAWQDIDPASGNTLIKVAKTGMKQPLTVYTSTPTSTPRLLALAGSYVFWDDGTYVIALDLRSGATAPVTTSNPPFSGVHASNGLIALNQIGSKGGATLDLAKATDLPPLKC